MGRRNPGKPRHDKEARDKLASAKALYRAVEDAGSGEPGPRQEVLLHAHMTASQAIQEAANAKSYGARDEAYKLLQKIESHLSRLRRPGKTNPADDRHEQALLDFAAQRGWLYHVTLAFRLPGIKKKGLDPHAAEGMAADSDYGPHSKGALFLSDAAGVKYWLAMAYGGAWVWAERGQKVGKKVLLRVPKRKCPVDKPGTADARGWIGKRSKATAYKCPGAIPASEIQMWDTKARQWKPLVKGNPYERRAKADYIAPDFYKYRGWTIDVRKRKPGLWEARVRKKGSGSDVYSASADSAAEMGRIQVDWYEYRKGLKSAGTTDDFDQMDAILRSEFRLLRGVKNRANLARRVEALRHRLQKDPDAFSPPDHRGVEFFYSLPLKERLAWLDTVVKFGRLAKGHWPNPAPKQNPGLRRFPDLPAAKRAAQREAKRRGYPHYVYQLAKNPCYAVLPASHPVQVSIERGTVGVNAGQLRYTAEPERTNPGKKKRKKGLTPIPAHIKIKRLPPGKAEGADLPGEYTRGAAGEKEKRRVDPSAFLMMGHQSYSPSWPKQNPYDSGQKVSPHGHGKFLYGSYEIRTEHDVNDPYPWCASAYKGGKRRHLEMPDPQSPNEPDRCAQTEAAAVERVRLGLDFNEWQKQKGRAYADQIQSEIQQAINHFVEVDGVTPTREQISRKLAEEEADWRREAKSPDLGDQVAAGQILKAFEAFNDLPLKDRLGWLDLEFKDFKLMEGLPITNPRRRKAKKKASAKRDRSTFRRLMRL